MNSRAKKNPLFIVKKDGKTVEEADNLFDALIKKLGFEEVIEFFLNMIKLLLDQVTNYSSLQVVKTLLDQFINSLEMFIKAIDPVLAFSIFKR